MLTGCVLLAGCGAPAVGEPAESLSVDAAPGSTAAFVATPAPFSASAAPATTRTTAALPSAQTSGPAPALASTPVDPPAPTGVEFSNPVLSQDFPDPSVLEVDGTFYLYGTETRGTNLQVQSSPDLVDWTAHPDPLPVLGSWTGPRKTWAPEVIMVGAEFVLFYTAADRASGRQCIGRAVADTPLGPFVDDAPGPFLCQLDLGGSIDANPFTGPDGSRYLYWKSDGNCCGLPVGLWGQRLDDAARALVGEPVELLTNTQPWQGPLIEGPEMVAHDGGYFLFYAGNSYASTGYAEGVARCAGPLGPCVDGPAPVLTSNEVAAGPGHGFVFSVGDQWWIVYHAYPPDAVGSAVPGRQVWLDRVTWTPDGPVVEGPTGSPQLGPVG